MWFLYTAVLLLSLMALLYQRYISRHAQPEKSRRKHVKTLAVLGSGGHTTEMIELLKALTPDIYQPRVYVVADTDKMSFDKVETFEKGRGSKYYEVEQIPRSREVGQSYLTSVVTTLHAIFYSFQLVWKHKPDLLLLNGPGTCIPIALVAALFDMMRLTDTRIIYEESICRVQRLSLSGLILYYTRLTDDLIVQWPQLVEKYPRCRYIELL